MENAEQRPKSLPQPVDADKGDEVEKSPELWTTAHHDERCLSYLYMACVSRIGVAINRASSPTQALLRSLIRLRLTRWGQAVRIFEDPPLERRDFDPEDVSEGKEALSKILGLPSAENATPNAANPPSSAMDGEITLLLQTLEKIASERCPTTGLNKNQRTEQADLSEAQLEIVARTIGKLEGLFGVHGIRELRARERRQIEDKIALGRLIHRNLVRGLDPWIFEDMHAFDTYPDSRRISFTRVIEQNKAIDRAIMINGNIVRADIEFINMFGKARNG